MDCHARPVRDLRAPLALIALTLLAYLPAVPGGFIWDDNDYVTANPTLRDAAGLAHIWTDPHGNWQYYPLVFTTFWLEYHAWGLHPLGYHLDNVLIQGCSAVLLYFLLRKLNLPAPWLAAAIFAVHPVGVESVAWITERKNVLCGFFYLSAMLVYLRQKRGSYWIALALFVCALLSKTVAVTWPLAMGIILWQQTGRLRSKDIFRLIPFVLVGFSLGLLTTQLEMDQVGATGPDWDLSLTDRCIIAGRAVWFYAGKVVCPARLTFIYPKWDLQAHRAIQLAIAAAAAIVLLALRCISRGAAAAGWIFVLTLFPALGFFNVYPMRYSFVADHFQYLAMIALIVPAASLLRRGMGKWACLVLLPLAVLTWRQCEIYHNSLTLWTDTVAKNPSWMPRINLGQEWQARGRLDLAEQQYRAATLTAPDEADTWWKLGAFQASQGRLAEGESNLRRALEADPRHPGARADLAKVLQLEGK